MTSQEELERHHRTHNEILVLPPSFLIEECLSEACLIEECLWARVWGKGMLLIYEGGRGSSAKIGSRVGVRRPCRPSPAAPSKSRQEFLTLNLGPCQPVELVYLIHTIQHIFWLSHSNQRHSLWHALGRGIIRIINPSFCIYNCLFIPQSIVISIDRRISQREISTP